MRQGELAGPMREVAVMNEIVVATAAIPFIVGIAWGCLRSCTSGSTS